MVDSDLPSKSDEQYPLLKVESGAGDSCGHVQVTAPTMTPNWIGRCSPKQSWFTRWPELFSACWMTLVLLGISLLVFYALGMSVYRRNQIIVVKYKNTNPASKVYYHHIIPRGIDVNLILYSEYIADMATRYPSLQFNIYFLSDDSKHDGLQSPRYGKYINKIIPSNTVKFAYNSKLDENTERQLRDFEKSYENVNVTVMTLSKFMAITPLKYYWRSIPFNLIPFYLRVFSVWENGGIGIDLTTFNNLFIDHKHVDRKILAILQQHNDGIKATDYSNALNRANCDEETDFFEIFITFVNQLVNETKSLFNNSQPFSPVLMTENDITYNTTLKRNHRNKRDLYKTEVEKTKIYEKNSSDRNANEIKNMSYIKISNLSDTSHVINNVNLSDFKNNGTNDSVIEINPKMLLTKPINGSTDTKSQEIKNITPHVIMFYDFSIFKDNLGPSYMVPEMIYQSDFGLMPKRSEVKLTKPHKNSQFLSLNSDGTFIAASSRLHPFLGYLLSSAYRCVDPKIAIRDTFTTRCFNMFRNDHYCNNIFML